MSVDAVQSRTEVTFKGKPMTLRGPELRVGDPAPDFALTAGDLSTVTPEMLLDEGKRAAMLIVVPSLDTSVCSLESQKFNARLGELPPNVTRRGRQLGSAFRTGALVRRAGRRQAADALRLSRSYVRRELWALDRELGLLARAIVVIGKDRTVTYVQIVPEVADEPDYDAALKAAAAAA